MFFVFVFVAVVFVFVFVVAVFVVVTVTVVVVVVFVVVVVVVVVVMYLRECVHVAPVFEDYPSKRAYCFPPLRDMMTVFSSPDSMSMSYHMS